MQPETRYYCKDCGIELDEGTGKTFTVGGLTSLV